MHRFPSLVRAARSPDRYHRAGAAAVTDTHMGGVQGGSKALNQAGLLMWGTRRVYAGDRDPNPVPGLIAGHAGVLVLCGAQGWLPTRPRRLKRT